MSNPVKKEFTLAEFAEILGVSESVVRKHVGSYCPTPWRKDESGNVYVPRHWIEDLIKTLYFLNEYLLASVLEARLQDWLAANGYS